jgi:antitoxin ParD1/3/4
VRELNAFCFLAAVVIYRDYSTGIGRRVMTTLNISLPETLQSFVEQQVAKGGYSNVSEYILHLILQEQAKAARVEALLLEGLDSGEPIEVTDDWWEQKRTQLMQGLQQTQE